MFDYYHNSIFNILLQLFLTLIEYNNDLFAQLYGIKYSYLSQIIYTKLVGLK